MGANGKAVVTFGMLILDAPTHAKNILEYLVQLVPMYEALPPMVQAGVMFFLVALPVSYAGSRLVWQVPNTIAPEPTPPPVFDRPLPRASIIGNPGATS